MARQFSENVLAESVRQLSEKKNQIETNLEKYSDLEQSLVETAKVSTKEVMIPLSSVGFIRGKLNHTNEVYVHLGANYFVQRTAHEC